MHGDRNSCQQNQSWRSACIVIRMHGGRNYCQLIAYSTSLPPCSFYQYASNIPAQSASLLIVFCHCPKLPSSFYLCPSPHKWHATHPLNLVQQSHVTLGGMGMSCASRAPCNHSWIHSQASEALWALEPSQGALGPFSEALVYSKPLEAKSSYAPAPYFALGQKN